ncbi:MFS transporter family glucose-6-phosphate receptor UhpC [Vibrio aestuarianus]|uniref:MFS transporter family glucose-6-phosphate receptor UhpC n=1 Tax=Vibrio aestuarianus TaxID=28171 RepID=A0A7X6N7H5_9VIBR|nr:MULTISPECIES: MFS transporter family glucose-6-phosphate receptor UhpC [Vibrio]MDE1209113.1 MFS transporter family glucose-6-phosphate receptor UhpC [Vibrio aestuarianus]MDE1221730.1 MFS transporter family glucose-6-phosphate receptor UhpC [Vibrio aestuarianus]MDE1224758.1 MFS transporter family glucose-6-phosphate receptor UhpC [Vibrio aestuarianus]MDE1232427.1 MFS transporter family glucose-6-phosphate receptor UhpC [Vibrio aestuarianus]MDE1236335.1 MFS transporter family glucose-6-phosph
MMGFMISKPTSAPIESSQIDATYRYWRLHLMLSMYVGYGVFYFTRKSLNFAMPAMLSDLGLEHSDFGILGTLFYVTYGLSKFVSGMVSDQSKPSYFMGLGLIATGVINVLFGFSSSLAVFAVLWTLNAFFQGWGWPPCAKLLTTWYSRTERGFWWSIWNTCHNLSGALIPLSIGFIAVTFGWRYGFIAPGCLAIVVGLVLCFRMQDKPITLGLPSVGEWRNDALEKRHEAEGKGLNFSQILRIYVLGNKYIWLLCSSYFLVYVVRIAINDWGNLYLTERHGYDLFSANTAVSMFEIGGFLGSLFGGWGSDKFFRGNRAPMNLIFALGIFISVAALWLTPINNFVVLSGCFFSIGFFIFGPQMMIGMAAAECSHKDAAGTATGFVGLFGYLGAALASYPLALIIEQFSWEGFFSVITLSAALIGLLILPFLKAQQRAGNAVTMP